MGWAGWVREAGWRQGGGESKEKDVLMGGHLGLGRNLASEKPPGIHKTLHSF